jgi:glycosyltransferase involved in cell wall biosynthesis
MRAAYRRIARERGDVTAVHFHGVRPWLLGLLEAKAWPDPPTCYLSPHGSRLLPLLPLAMAWGRRQRRRAGAPAGAMAQGVVPIIATNGVEARRLHHMGLAASASYPVVGEPYLASLRREAPQAAILAGTYVLSHTGADRFARLAVILSNAVPQLSFQWLGPCPPGTRAQLEAAGVGLLDDQHGADQQADREQRALTAMGAAWLFVATVPDPRMPLMLAQAMAAGLACVAINTPTHADLIEHGRNGWLVDDEAGLLAAVCALIDEPARREQLGAAARTDARRKFGRSQLTSGLTGSYGEAFAPGRAAGASPAPIGLVGTEEAGSFSADGV